MGDSVVSNAALEALVTWGTDEVMMQLVSRFDHMYSGREVFFRRLAKLGTEEAANELARFILFKHCLDAFSPLKTMGPEAENALLMVVASSSSHSMRLDALWRLQDVGGRKTAYYVVFVEVVARGTAQQYMRVYLDRFTPNGWPTDSL